MDLWFRVLRVCVGTAACPGTVDFSFQAVRAAGKKLQIRTLLKTEHVFIEVLNVKVHVFVLLLFATLPDCSQNQTAVSDTLRLLSDF